MNNVTLVTKDSEKKSPHTPQEWRDMYDDLKGELSLGKFQEKYGIGLSRAAWNKYERGEMPLSNDMKAELRRVVGLPVTVAEAVSIADVNAAVYRVGNNTPHTVVMLGTTEDITLHINGSVGVCNNAPAMPSRNAQDARKPRKQYIRPCATVAQDSRRSALGVDWDDVIEAGLRCYEVMA